MYAPPPRRVTQDLKNRLGNSLMDGQRDELEAMNYYDNLLSNIRGLATRFPDSAAALRRMENEIAKIRNQEFMHRQTLTTFLSQVSSL